jgi:F-box-like
MRAAIDDLSDELLAAIFEELEYAERGDRDEVPPQPVWEAPLDTSYLRWPTCDKFNVAAVSRRWFAVATSTPRLWNELYVDIDWDAATLANTLQQILTRSKNQPLTVSIINLTDQPFTRETPEAYHVCANRTTGEILSSIDSLFAALAPVSSRIYSLAFEMAGCSDGVALLSKWSSPLPAIHLVSIEKAPWNGGFYGSLKLPSSFLSCIQAPCVFNITDFLYTTWTLEGSSPLPFTDVRVNPPCIDAVTTEVTNLHALVKRCNKLNSLRLYGVVYYGGDNWTHDEQIFASLREIHVEGESNFFEILMETSPFPTFPKVTHLTFYNTFASGLHQVFAHNFPSLQELTVQTSYSTGNANCVLFLRNLPPSLQVLRLPGWANQGLLAYLAQQPAYLPELRALWLDEYRFPARRYTEMEAQINARGLQLKYMAETGPFRRHTLYSSGGTGDEATFF